MPTLKELIILDARTEYESAYDLSNKRNFSNPKIYSAGGDLTKRWYVYFSFRDSNTGKMKRITPFYGNANKYKTKEDRLSVLVTYRKVLLRLLKQGYSPFKDNTSLYLNRSSKETLSKSKSKHSVTKKTKPEISIQEAFAFGLKQKEKIVNATTKRSYDNRVKIFLEWLQKEHIELTLIP